MRNSQLASYILLLLLVIMILASAWHLNGAPPTRLGWLRPGVYARYVVVVEHGNSTLGVPYSYKMKHRFQVLLRINESDLVEIVKGKYMARKLGSILCDGLVYEWRVLEVNSTHARVRLRLILDNATLDVSTYKATSSGSSLVSTNTTRYPRMVIEGDVYVGLEEDRFSYDGVAGQWVYWLNREMLSNSTILILTNVTLPAIYPTRHVYMALSVKGPASQYGYCENITVSNHTLGPERLAVASGQADLLAVLRMIGLEVPENASRKDVIRLLYQYQDVAVLMSYGGTLWYDMGTGVMVRADMDPASFVGYSDDALYKVLGIAGFFPLEPPGQRSPWSLVLNETNLDFRVVVLGGEEGGGVPGWALIAIFAAAAALIAAAWWRRTRR